MTLGGKILSVADDCKVFRVSADGEEIYASSASSIVKDQGTYADKVWYKTTDGEVTTIVESRRWMRLLRRILHPVIPSIARPSIRTC